MFFFKQKTAYEMRMSDWSSDVCSSDLAPRPRIIQRQPDGPRELKHELGDLAQVRLQPCAIDGTLAEAGAEGIVLSAEPVDLRAELAQMGTIADQHRAAAALVFIGRTAAAPGGADLDLSARLPPPRPGVAMEGGGERPNTEER